MAGFTSPAACAVDNIARWDGNGLVRPERALRHRDRRQVHALAVFDDGSGPALYAGGGFTDRRRRHRQQHRALGRRRVVGAQRTTGNGVDGRVSAFAVFDDGSGPALYAGGGFETAGGVTVNSVARWDGSAWSDLSGPSGTGVGGGGGLYGGVNALAVFDDGSGSGAVRRRGVRNRRWRDGQRRRTVGRHGLDRAQRAVRNGRGSSGSWRVAALDVFDDGSGPRSSPAARFMTAGGVTVNNIARWDGTSWSPSAGSGRAGHRPVRSRPRRLRRWLRCGAVRRRLLRTVDDVVVNNIARWDGSSWSGLSGPSGSGVHGWIDALAVFDDGSGPALFAGGCVDTAGGVTVMGVAHWDGSAWSAVGTGVQGWVYGFAVLDGSSGPALYAGGEFVLAGDVTANNVARWDGVAWSAFSGPSGTGVGSAGYWSVEALAGFDDGSGPALYAGGYFDTAGGVASHSIAAWRCPAASSSPTTSKTDNLGLVAARRRRRAGDRSGTFLCPARPAGGAFVGSPVGLVAAPENEKARPGGTCRVSRLCGGGVGAAKCRTGQSTGRTIGEGSRCGDEL